MCVSMVFLDIFGAIVLLAAHDFSSIDVLNFFFSALEMETRTLCVGFYSQ